MPKGMYQKSLEQKKRISKSLMGHHVSTETRMKISEKRNKNPNSNFKKGNKCVQNRKSFIGWMTGKKHSFETKEKIRYGNIGKHSGEKNPFWKGGITKERALIYASSEYKKWRKTVFERDNYTCQMCFQKGGKLNADHIKPFSLFPNLRFDLDNGRTLCLRCHRKTPTFGNFHKRYIAMELVK